VQETLEQFVRALRAAEVRVSPAEAIDAARAARAVGFADRALFKDALCVTLAKSAWEVERFDSVFDAFFARGALSQAPPEGEAGSDGAEAAGVADSPLAQMLLRGDAVGLAQAMEDAASAAKVSDIRVALQRNLLAWRMLERMGLAQVERIIADARRSPDGEGLAERLERGRRALMDDARAYVERQFGLYASGAGRKLREEALAQQALSGGLSPTDLVLMQAVVKRMAKRLAARYSRRRRAAQRGHLDVRKTLRRSMAHEGIPFEIAWKVKKVQRPSIVAICDVSKSVAAAAQFLLTFLYALNEVVERLDAFAFSGRLIPVGDILDENGAEAAIFKVLSTIGFQSTDYGRALADFCDQHLDRLDRHTTVIILGDGRSNYGEPRLDLMRQIQQRSRAVIWLNPERESFWGQGDSVMDRYARFTHVAKTCNTLAGLERIIDDVLRTYLPH
jgi:uncharacterized protein with von Willebrand factor type A (vWA) domain